MDASGVNSGWLELNHDYFVTEPRVTRDLIELLRKGNRDPGGPGRFFQPRRDEPGVWVMMPDETAGPPMLTEEGTWSD